jgi:hypothetical protein
MKKLILLLGLPFFFTSCFIDFSGDSIFGCKSGRGDIVTKEFVLPHFDRVHLNLAGDLFVSMGDEQRIVIEGQPNVIDQIDDKVKNEKWEIEFNGCMNNYDDLKIYVTLPRYEEITLNGSGKVYGETVITANDLDVNLSGSGSIDLETVTSQVSAVISGSGKIFMEGETEEFDLKLSGSGDFKGYNLLTVDTDILVSGSGDTEIFTSDFLKVRISGSGDVFYKGQPDLDVKVVGSGEVIDAN